MSANPLKFCYFGTPTFSTIVLDELAKAGLTPALVVTTPDRPAGRGLALVESPVKEWARSHGIPFLQPREYFVGSPDIAALAESGCSTAVVAAYGKILPGFVLDLFPGRALNVHPSLLPRYRGSSPVESQIIADEPHIGVSVILMDTQMDHGPIIAQEEIAQPDWPLSRNALNERLWRAGGKLLARVLTNEPVAAQPQDHTQATYTKKITKEDGNLDLAAPGRENYLKYLAYEGWPGTFFFKGSTRYKITEAALENGAFVVKRVIPEGKSETSWKA